MPKKTKAEVKRKHKKIQMKGLMAESDLGGPRGFLEGFVAVMFILMHGRLSDEKMK